MFITLFTDCVTSGKPFFIHGICSLIYIWNSGREHVFTSYLFPLSFLSVPLQEAGNNHLSTFKPDLHFRHCVSDFSDLLFSLSISLLLCLMAYLILLWRPHFNLFYFAITCKFWGLHLKTLCDTTTDPVLPSPWSINSFSWELSGPPEKNP